MTHLAATAIVAVLRQGAAPSQQSLSRLRVALAGDSGSYLFNSYISLIEAMLGIREKRYGWACVKSYYSAFYAMRAHLAALNTCLHFSSKKYHAFSFAGAPRNNALTGSTHASVLLAYKRHPSTRHIIQPIEHEDAPTWLKKKREQANYELACFSDPVPPGYIAGGLDVFNHAHSYIADIDTYCYDPAHATIAFPIKVIIAAKRAGASTALSEDQLQHIKMMLADAPQSVMDFFA